MKTVTCTMISGSFKTHIIKYLPAYVQKSYQLITLTFTSIQSNQNRTFKIKVVPEFHYHKKKLFGRFTSMYIVKQC